MDHYFHRIAVQNGIDLKLYLRLGVDNDVFSCRIRTKITDSDQFNGISAVGQRIIGKRMDGIYTDVLCAIAEIPDKDICPV